eukprot:COSAG03_NODE_8329_length_813_cov_0.697479_1_plen_114_part_01
MQVLLASCESTAESLKHKLAKALGGASASASAAELEQRGLVMQPPNVGSETLRLKPYQLLGLNWLCGPRSIRRRFFFSQLWQCSVFYWDSVLLRPLISRMIALSVSLSLCLSLS